MTGVQTCALPISPQGKHPQTVGYIGGSERAMLGASPVSVRFGPGPTEGGGHPRAQAARPAGPVRTVAQRAGRGRRGHRAHARVSLTRALCSPGGNRPAGRRMTWRPAVQPMLLQSAASVGEGQKDQPERARGSPGTSAGRALRRQCRYFLAKELAGHPDHGGCGWVKWYARADRGTDTAPEECGHCLAGELAM